MPNNDQTWQQAAQFVTSCFLRVYQQQQQQYILNIWKNLSFKPKHALLKSGIDTEKKRAQNLVDQVFEYVAPSLFVTSVLASGELVGSTIWGISKYISKDIIYNTLGATTAAVILQSAELVGYRNEVQEFFGIKPAEKRATLAIKIGGKLGQASGGVAGTALTLLVGPWVLPLFPVLAPYLPLLGLFVGGIAGELIGAGVGAGLNNLVLSTIDAVPSSYKGIKEKGGKFADRIKNSIAEKRKLKQGKSTLQAKENAKENVVNVNGEGPGSHRVLPIQKLPDASDAVPANQLNPPRALVPVAQVRGVPIAASVQSNLTEGVVSQSPAHRDQQRNQGETPVVPSANEITRESGNKTGVGNSKRQEAGGLSASKKKSEKTTSSKEGRETLSASESGKNKTPTQTNPNTKEVSQSDKKQGDKKIKASQINQINENRATQTNPNKKVKQSPQPRVSQSPATTPKNTKTKTNDQSVYEALEEAVTEEGGEWQKVPTKKELNAEKKQKKLEAEAKRKEAEDQQKPKTGYSSIRLTVKTPPQQKHEVNVSTQKTKFTKDIQPKNTVKNVLTEGKKNKGQPHSQKAHNKSGQKSQSPGIGRNQA
jgi:hypothetical protein